MYGSRHTAAASTPSSTGRVTRLQAEAVHDRQDADSLQGLASLVRGPDQTSSESAGICTFAAHQCTAARALFRLKASGQISSTSQRPHILELLRILSKFDVLDYQICTPSLPLASSRSCSHICIQHQFRRPLNLFTLKFLLDIDGT